MTVDPYMGFTYSVDHGSLDVWGALVNTALGLIGAHDHTSGKGKQVPSLGIGLDADLTFASFAATNVKAVDFAAAASTAVTGYAGALFMSDGTGGLAANDLYWRTTTGTNVRVTAGTSLNVAAFVGGIGGDYSSVSALLDYNDANKEYRHRQGGGTAWARITGGGLRLLEFGSTETVYVEQLCPAALASSYAMTWPVALPGSTALVSISNTGAIAFGATYSFTRSFFATFISNGSSFVVAGNPVAGDRSPVWKSGALGTATFGVPFTPGETITGFAYEAYGDGAVDITSGRVLYYTGMTAAATVLASWADTNRAAAWGSVNIGTFTSQLLGAGGVLNVELNVNAANYHFGQVSASFTKTSL